MDEDEEIIDVEIPIPPQAKFKNPSANGDAIPLPPGASLKKKEQATPVTQIGGSGSKNGSISSQNTDTGLTDDLGLSLFQQQPKEQQDQGIELPPKMPSGEQRINVPAEGQFEVQKSRTNYAKLAESFPDLQEGQVAAEQFKKLEEIEKSIRGGSFDISKQLEKPDLAAQSGEFVARALNLPEFVNTNVQGLLEGYDKARTSLAMMNEAVKNEPAIFSKKYYVGLTGALLGGAHMTFSTAMNSPAGYAFTQAINADQIYSNGEVSNFIMAPVSTLFPQEGALGQNITGLFDVAGSLAILGGTHAILKGDRAKAQKINEALQDVKDGKELNGADTQLLTETIAEEATPQNLERIQKTVESLPEDTPPAKIPEYTSGLMAIDEATLSKIPEDLKPETKIEVAPLIEEKQNLEKQKEKVDESFHPEIDESIEQIKSEINEKIKSSGLRVRSIKPKTTEDAIQIEKGKIERFDEIKSDFSELVDITELKKFADTDSFLRNLESKGLITIEC